MLAALRPPSAIPLRRLAFAVVVAVFCCLVGIRSGAQSIKTIGVIDWQDGPLTRGAQLAANVINESRRIVDADGFAVSLRVMSTPPDDMDTALSDLRQADVIAVIGPASGEALRDNLPALVALNAPILTTDPDDALLTEDDTGLVFRALASEKAQNRALARYLGSKHGARTIISVQLEAASTSSLIGLATALAEFRIGASNLFYDEASMGLGDIADRIAPQAPDAVIVHGPSLLAAQSVNLIRAAGYSGPLAYNLAAEADFRQFVPPRYLNGIISAVPWSYAIKAGESQRFALAFTREFGGLPSSESVAAYDAVGMVAGSLRSTLPLAETLAQLRAYKGVQGALSPGALTNGETSQNVAITQLNEHGAPVVAARYDGDAIVQSDESLLRIITATPPPSPTPDGFWLTVLSGVQNVRGGPSTDFEIIGKLTAGAKARVLAQSEDRTWFVIDYRGQFGWLAGWLVRTWGSPHLVPIMAPPATPTPLPSPTPPPQADADLVIMDAYPQRLILDTPSLIQVTVRNQGLAAAGPFAVAASLQPGARYAGVNLPGLGGGQRATLQLTQTLTGATGPQAVIIVADLNSQVNEGPAGEANNRVFVYEYIADREIIRRDTWTSHSGALDLDSDGAVDLLWTGTDLVALDGALYRTPEFRSIDEAHYDGLRRDHATAGALHIDRLPNAVIGVFTGSGRRGVVQVLDVVRDGVISLAFRVYR